MEQIRIQVQGVPGSGKSFICSQLPKRIKCFDTDDYITMAYDILSRRKVKITYDNVSNLARRLLVSDIKKHPVVVVVGITFEVPNSTKKYFIKMSNKELAVAYKRTIIREINKYKKITKPSVIKHISQLDNDKISQYLSDKYHINAMEPVGTTFAIYKKRYRGALKSEKQRGFIIKTQKAIIDELQKIK